MKLVVGLGNPGAKYAGTRHNVGFDVVDILATRWNLTLTVEKFHGWFAQGRYGDEQVVLLKPTTFMNRCGQAVSAAGRFYKLDLPDSARTNWTRATEVEPGSEAAEKARAKLDAPKLSRMKPIKGYADDLEE